MKMSEINLAAQALFDGKIVIFPTETVYGIGTNAEKNEAIDRIYKIKNRPRNRPLIIHIPEKKLINYWFEPIPDYAEKLVENFWPGPLTLVFNRNKKLPNYILPNQSKLAVRMPNHPKALQLLDKFSVLGGKGVVAPSANIFGQISPTTIDEARISIGSKLERGDILLDGGKCSVGIESTILACIGNAPTILRPGSITKSRIEEIINSRVFEDEAKLNTPNKFPGYSNSHYAPKAKVRTDSGYIDGSGFIALAKYKTPRGLQRIISPLSIEEFSRDLYSAFFKVDELQLKYVFVKLPVKKGIGVALINRIQKASNNDHD